MSGSGAKNLRSGIPTEAVSPISVDWDGSRRSASPNNLIVLYFHKGFDEMDLMSFL